MKKYFITGNTSKYREISKSIPGLVQLDLQKLVEIQSLDIEEIISYKLIEAKNKLNSEYNYIIVEDTGLYLSALNDFPGPLIKFMLKSVGNEGIYKICKGLNNFEAKATTSFGVYNSSEDKISFHTATIEGIITSPRGEFGFGWDQIFCPIGSNKTFAEMESIEEKNKYSMRCLALLKLISKEKINET